MIAFDKDTCTDFETAQSKEWLETNGLGGFASSTVINCNTRRYHGLLIAATQPPAGRTVMVNALEEWVTLNDVRYDLSCHQYPGVLHPQGHKNLIGFRLDPWPIWTYRLGPLILEKSLTMIHGQNTVIVTYKMRKECQGATLMVRPFMTGREFHALHKENPALCSDAKVQAGVVTLAPYDGLPPLYFHHSGRFVPGFNWYREMEYTREEERGLDAHEDCWAAGEFQFPLQEGHDAVFIATSEGSGYFDAQFLLNAERNRRRALLSGWEATDDVTHHLVLAADQFLVGPAAKTPEVQTSQNIIAGYPWFEEWGRDTFIALPGLLLATSRFEEARQILKSYAHWLNEGMVPNRFPEHGGQPEYNSVDASLWYLVAIFHYLRYTKDFDFVAQHLWPVMKDIIAAYQNGTRYQIHMDLDGLLFAGQPGVQLTWMDARIGDWEVTPRIGKPVEIQALWYNALRIMEQVAAKLEEKDASRKWGSLAEKVWASFNKQFWNEETGTLCDVVHGSERDVLIRPNQIFAISLPFDTLSPERALRVVNAVEEKLLTPFGLRTLDPHDSHYASRYQGDTRTRDSAYHQGTVWPWLMGPFLTAYQKVHGKSAKTQSQMRAHLALLLTHLWEAGLGTISEIFDGDMPHEPRGCIAQAWSVGEILRVLREELGVTSSSTAIRPSSEKPTTPSAPLRR